MTHGFERVLKSWRSGRLAVPLQLAVAGLVLAACTTAPGGAPQDVSQGQVVPTQLELLVGLQPGEYGVYSNLQLARMKGALEDPNLKSQWRKQKQIDRIKAQSTETTLTGVGISAY